MRRRAMRGERGGWPDQIRTAWSETVEGLFTHGCDDQRSPYFQLLAGKSSVVLRTYWDRGRQHWRVSLDV